MTDVAPATATALRSAMSRLLAGKPARTDGRLIKENLRKEAGVSRATMNRAKAILSEWDQAVAERGSLTPGEARRDEQIDTLRKQLASKTRQCTTLQHRLDAAATAIAALHHDNAALREQLDRHGPVRSLDARRSRTAR
jgi:chromosome segregation ATPase